MLLISNVVAKVLLLNETCKNNAQKKRIISLRFPYIIFTIPKYMVYES